MLAFSLSIKKVGVILLYLPLIILILLISVYPLQFFLVEGKVGILEMKSDALLTDWVWKTFFYTHISFGGQHCWWAGFNSIGDCVKATLQYIAP